MKNPRLPGTRVLSLAPMLRDRRGQALVEFAMVLPLLLVVVLGLIEFGRALGVANAMARGGREGANIAARGTGLDTVLNVILDNGREIHLAERGGAIVSRVDVESDGPMVIAQVAPPELEGRSRLGTVGSSAASLAALGLEVGTTHYVVELFYDYRTVTPLPRFLHRLFPITMYDRSVF